MDEVHLLNYSTDLLEDREKLERLMTKGRRTVEVAAQLGRTPARCCSSGGSRGCIHLPFSTPDPIFIDNRLSLSNPLPGSILTSRSALPRPASVPRRQGGVRQHGTEARHDISLIGRQRRTLLIACGSAKLKHNCS